MAITLDPRGSPIYVGSGPYASPNETSLQSSILSYAQKFTVVGLPFVSLYKPAGFAFSLVVNSLRTATSITHLVDSMIKGEIKKGGYHTIETMVAMGALVSTIFGYPLSKLIVVSHALLASLGRIVHHFNTDNDKEALIAATEFFNNTLYLGLLLTGSLELLVISTCIEILLGLYQGKTEFVNDHSIIASAHLLMVGIRFKEVLA